MTIQVEPKNADSLVDALREDTASAEDLQRIERGLARQLAHRGAVPAPRSFVPGLLVLSTFAVALLVWVMGPGEGVMPLPPPTVASAHVGQVIEGPAPVETQLGNALLAVSALSSVRVDEIDITRAAVTLVRGEVRVVFHPEHRGEEHLAVMTPAARVDVVGTEFTVSISEDGGTRVEVFEGIVRVTPTSGAEATLVEAGGSIDLAVVVAAVVVQDEVAPEAPAVVEAVAVVDEARHERPSTHDAPLTDESRLARIAALQGEADDRAVAHDYAAVAELNTRILALDPHDANALFDRAQMRELHLGDPTGARADYARYLAEHADRHFAAQAQQGLDRLSPVPSTP